MSSMKPVEPIDTSSLDQSLEDLERVRATVAGAHRLPEPAAAGDVESRLDKELREAEVKAWEALSRYKFLMAGYWMGVWVHLNRVSGRRQANPWRCLVKLARHVVSCGESGAGWDAAAHLGAEIVDGGAEKSQQQALEEWD